MIGITFDTAVLIAIERRRDRALRLLRMSLDEDAQLTVPVAVIAEWWRGRSDVRERIIASVRVEPMDEPLARAVGEALAAVAGSTIVDAIVMASAARRGDTVYTGDPDDLLRLQRHFPSVRVLTI